MVPNNYWTRLNCIAIFIYFLNVLILNHSFCHSFRSVHIPGIANQIKNNIKKNYKINSINKNVNYKSKDISSNTFNFAIAEFSDDDIPSDEIVEVKTHGYEGSFNVGDIVKVSKNIKIWCVKPYTKDGFECKGFVGKVHSLALYGRKLKTLCSAITPVKVEFEPTGEGIPSGMFERKWIAHFAGDELELIKKGEISIA